MTIKVNFRIHGNVIRHGYDRRTCWVQSRGGFIPRQGRAPTAIITMQKLLLSGCDVFGSLHVMRSDDDGHTWSGPTEQPGYGRFPAAEGLEGIVSDFIPSWHDASGKLLVTGQFCYYRGPFARRFCKSLGCDYGAKKCARTGCQMPAWPTDP